MGAPIRESNTRIIWISTELAAPTCRGCGAPTEVSEAMREGQDGRRERVTVVSCSGCERVHETRYRG